MYKGNFFLNLFKFKDLSEITIVVKWLNITNMGEFFLSKSLEVKLFCKMMHMDSLEP
jgi:hypothetical protein